MNIIDEYTCKCPYKETVVSPINTVMAFEPLCACAVLILKKIKK